MDNNLETEFYDLLGLKMSGDASPEELARLNGMLKENTALLSLYNYLENARGNNQPYPNEVLEQSYASHYVKKKLLAAPAPSSKNRSGHFRTYAAIAASFVMAVGIYYFIAYRNRVGDVPANFKNEVATEKGSRSKVMLPDSTLVVLNADSHLTYDHWFNTNTREVTLIGEAFFDVKHDEKRPFIIHTGKADIRVLGTAFNVRNYPQEDLLETSLIRGRIELTLDDKKGSKVILNPSEKIVISKSGITKTAASKPTGQEEDIFKLTRIAVKDSSIAELAWLNNQFSFVNKPLGEIAKELERQFNTTIIFKNEAVKQYRYTMHSDNYDLDEILHILKLSQNFNYRFVSKDTVTIE